MQQLPDDLVARLESFSCKEGSHNGQCRRSTSSHEPTEDNNLSSQPLEQIESEYPQRITNIATQQEEQRPEANKTSPETYSIAASLCSTARVACIDFGSMGRLGLIPDVHLLLCALAEALETLDM